MNRLIYHSGLYACSAALLKLAGFVFFLWLARTMSVEEYASWGLIYALQIGVTSFGLVGIVEAVVGLLKRHRTVEERKRLFSAANSVFLATSTCSIVLAVILFVVFVEPAASAFLTIICVVASGGLLAYSSLQAQIVRLEERHLASLWFSFVIPLCGLVGSFIAFVLENTVQSFFWGSAVGLVASLVGAQIKRVGFYRFANTVADWRPVLHRISPFIAVTLLGWLGGYGNTYIIKLFFASEEVAKFTFVFMLSSIMQLVATAMNQVWSPRFYRLIHEVPLDQVEIQHRRFFRLQGIALGLTGGALIAIYPLALNMLGGNLSYYQSVHLELVLLVLSYVVLIPWWHCQNYFLAYDKGPSVMRILVATSVIGVAILVILLLILGPLGIYVGFFAQMALRSAGALIVTRRNWMTNISWEGIAAGIILGCVGFLFTGGELQS